MVPFFMRYGRKCPERARDFSPTCSVAECGVNGTGNPMKS
ncbi:hypothetical protein Barb4_05316 [Bacteroidales bacterium Barb4]|nr:hypothetical protein Barb4_05316 [Bacteroidales bacterium Barb4]